MGVRPPDDGDQPWTAFRGTGYWRAPGSGLGPAPGPDSPPGQQDYGAYSGQQNQSAYPVAGWGGEPAVPYGPWGEDPKVKRRGTAKTLALIAVGTVLAIILVQVLWQLTIPDRLEVPAPTGVVFQADGLPEGYEYAATTGGHGDGLICGRVAWELVGEAPRGGHEAVEEAVDLLSSMTGLKVDPSTDVVAPAVRITVEFVSARAIEEAAEGGEGETIGLALTSHSAFGINASEILLNEPFFKSSLRSDSDEGVLVVLHELGHALGLGHSDSSESLMYPSISGETHITDADVAAFQAVMPKC
jgi:hypothetical protein